MERRTLTLNCILSVRLCNALLNFRTVKPLNKVELEFFPLHKSPRICLCIRNDDGPNAKRINRRREVLFSVFIPLCLFDLCCSFVIRMQKFWRDKKDNKWWSSYKHHLKTTLAMKWINKHAHHKQTRNKPFGNRIIHFGGRTNLPVH